MSLRLSALLRDVAWSYLSLSCIWTAFLSFSSFVLLDLRTQSISLSTKAAMWYLAFWLATVALYTGTILLSVDKSVRRCLGIEPVFSARIARMVVWILAIPAVIIAIYFLKMNYIAFAPLIVLAMGFIGEAIYWNGIRKRGGVLFGEVVAVCAMMTCMCVATSITIHLLKLSDIHKLFGSIASTLLISLVVSGCIHYYASKFEGSAQ